MDTPLPLAAELSAPIELPLDPAYQELTEGSARAMANVARAVISAEGVRYLKAQVTSVVTEGTRRFVTLKRPENDIADVKPYPVVQGGYAPKTNEWVNALETPGGLVVLGLEAETGAPTVPGLASGSGFEAGAIPNGALASNYALINHGHGSHNHSTDSVAGHSHSTDSVGGHFHNQSSIGGHTHTYGYYDGATWATAKWKIANTGSGGGHNHGSTDNGGGHGHGNTNSGGSHGHGNTNDRTVS